MRRLSLLCVGILMAAAPVFAQSTVPKFDATSVQASTKVLAGMRGGVPRGNRYELRNATMLDLVRLAYNVTADKVSGGPSWLEWTRYDVAGLAPEGTAAPVLRDMLKALLVDRFGLKVREDQVATTGMALKLVGTGTPKTFRPSTAAANCQGQGKPEPSGIPAQNVTCTGMTMAAFADQLPRMAGAYFPGGQQLVDETGLSGAFDFELKWMARALLAQAGGDAIPLDKGLADIGLKLEPKEMKAAAIVVENVNATFTANAPDVARRMAPLPQAFEVGEVKPSPAGGETRLQITPSGQINASNVPLNVMIREAWSLPSVQYVVGPKWLESTNFELIARAFTGSNANVAVDDDILRLMLQTLIVDRFSMKYHIEDRPMPAYTLAADQPKMAKADPAKRTRCVQGQPPPNLRGAAALQPRQFTCTNVSMAQFGTLIPAFAGGYTQVPVLDKTGLEGGFDFTLSFTGAGQAQPRPTNSAGGTAALDPNGLLSLPEAVSQQLGLKMEEQKRPQPVMVIDSISEKPTEN
jgi:uncharacterized protein (TIGR03435 family)